MSFNSQGNGELKSQVFVTESWLIDRYIGNTSWGWGYNPFGQLGDNTTTQRSSPVQTIAGGTSWKQVACGYGHTAAVKTDGTLWTWGQGNYGQLGNSSTGNTQSPVQTVAAGTNWKQVTCGGQLTAAIKTDGTLWLCGYNGGGQLATNSTTSYSSPVQTICQGTNWKQVSSLYRCVGAIKTDSTLWMWGENQWGQLGDNSLNYRSSPVQTVAGGTNWKQVSCGVLHAAAVKTDGTLWLWGYNGNGRLGDGTVTHRSSPVQTVAGGTNWKQVSCGYGHAAAIKTDGTLWLWGRNTGGQLGTNDISDRNSPVQTICQGTNWKYVVCGYGHTAAIKTDGTLWLWGVNTLSQLGDNTTTNRSSPVQTISGGTNWKYVAVPGQTYFTIATTFTDVI